MFRFQARLLSAIDGMSAQDRALVRMFLGRRADRSTVAALDVGDVDLPFPSRDKLVMLSWDDAFPGRVLNLDRWRPAFSQTDRPGFRVRQQDGLYLRFPEGFTDRVFGSEPPIVPLFGLSDPGTALWGGVEHRRTLSGDFTVEVDFDRFQQATAAVSSPTAVPAGIVRAGLIVSSLNTQRTGPLAAVYRTANPAGPGDVWESQIQPTAPPPTVATAAATGTSGSLRIQRVSGQLSTWFRPTGGSWTQVGATTAFPGDNLRVALLLETTYAPGAVRFTAFRETEQNDWPATATYESPIFDTGQPGVAWDVLTWTETLPASTDVVIDVATQDSTPFGAWSYSGGYTNPAGSSLAGRTGRYLRYRVTMTNAGAAASPEFSKPRLTFGTGWQDRDYGFDGRGNMTLKQVVTAAGTVTETRTVNDLNQVTQNVVVDSSGTKTWEFLWTLNGQLEKKWYEVDGVEVVAWFYDWNEDGRLVEVRRIDTDPVTLVSTTIVRVGYTYCSIGRMLTRTVYVQDGVPVSTPVAARFEWDGWDLVREVAADGTEMAYYVPSGEILSFKRTTPGNGSEVYQIHNDSIGSTRAITDSTGTPVATYSFWSVGRNIVVLRNYGRSNLLQIRRLPRDESRLLCKLDVREKPLLRSIPRYLHLTGPEIEVPQSVSVSVCGAKPGESNGPNGASGGPDSYTSTIPPSPGPTPEPWKKDENVERTRKIWTGGLSMAGGVMGIWAVCETVAAAAVAGPVGIGIAIFVVATRMRCGRRSSHGRRCSE